MRDTAIRTLIELGKEDKDIELITGDLGFMYSKVSGKRSESVY